VIVLIAEDDPTSRQLLEKAVGALGYEVLTAADGLVAWNIIRQREVRVVIADWEMPGMNGLSLCRRVRSGVLPHYLFFILLTSKTGKNEIIEGLEAGADDYLTKPFDRSELAARLRTGRRIVDLEYELSAKNEILEDLNGRLQRMALTDPLTEIGNRRGFYDTLDRLHGKDGVSESGYALVMCDVDNFKSYNDSYGHVAGDQVLKDVTAAMKKCLRSNDGIFRYGGEEITVYLPTATLESGREVAQRICRAVEALKVPHSGNTTGFVTVSCGVAAAGDAASSAETKGREKGWEHVLSRADEALYLAKSRGRNRVEVAA